MIPAERNPVDAIWVGRPPPPLSPAMPHPLEFAGQSAAEKRAEIAEALRGAKQDAAVLTDPASIAWLLNIRGADVPFTPFALGFALVHADGRAELFMEPVKMPDETRRWLGNEVSLRGREELAPALRSLGRPDGARGRRRLSGVVRAGAAGGGREGVRPVPTRACCPRPARTRSSSRAHAPPMRAMRWRCAAFFSFCPKPVRGGSETEMSAAARLLAFRREVEGFRGESFPGDLGARRSTGRSSTTASPGERPAASGADEVYLIDSGAQYPMAPPT